MKNKKALLLSREWRIKRHIYSEIPVASERKLSYWTLYTRFCCQKSHRKFRCFAKYDLAIIAKPTEGFSEAENRF
jgi:hypothetical protein